MNEIEKANESGEMITENPQVRPIQIIPQFDPGIDISNLVKATFYFSNGTYADLTEEMIKDIAIYNHISINGIIYQQIRVLDTEADVAEITESNT